MLTEREIFDRLKGCLSEAARDCDFIAIQPSSGFYFERLRKNLKLAEGCCRQAAHWREDARWLVPGLKLEHAHQIARGWLHFPSVKAKKMFHTLAAALRQMKADIVRLETMATGVAGTILPAGIDVARSSRLILPKAPAVPAGLLMPTA